MGFFDSLFNKNGQKDAETSASNQYASYERPESRKSGRRHRKHRKYDSVKDDSDSYLSNMLASGSQSSYINGIDMTASAGSTKENVKYGFENPILDMCGEVDICPDLLIALFGTFAAAAIAALYTAITMIPPPRRKRRSLSNKTNVPNFGAFGSDITPLDFFVELGLEEFEDKIDKLAGGVSGGENDGWIGSLYNKLKGQFLPKDDAENTIDMDGLEPPVLTEAWGLKDVSKLFNNGTETDSPKTISASAEKMEEITNEEIELMEELKKEEDDYIRALQGDAKCQAKFWRCVAKVAKGGMKYANEPGGISQLFTKTMFRVAFHGGMGNAWNALMTIPEARKAKRCMNMQEECLNYEVIRSEAGSSEVEKPRLIVNPDFVHDIDTSDGATQFDADVQKQFEEAMNEI